MFSNKLKYIYCVSFYKYKTFPQVVLVAIKQVKETFYSFNNISVNFIKFEEKGKFDITFYCEFEYLSERCELFVDRT